MTLTDGTVATVIDLDEIAVRDFNAQLHAAAADGAATPPEKWLVKNPRGRHNLAAGVDAPMQIEIEGHAGYYCAGMNQQATVRINGTCATGVAENMMSGTVVVEGNTSQSAGATAHGGLLVIHGSAAARAGIALKGADIVIGGSAGHLTGFMAQKGRIVICGDAGDALGDSLYEARIYVRGSVGELGADCIEKPMDEEHVSEVAELLTRAGMPSDGAASFHRYGSARELYRFKVDNAVAYR